MKNDDYRGRNFPVKKNLNKKCIFFANQSGLILKSNLFTIQKKGYGANK